jgi:hypothetical protein
MRHRQLSQRSAVPFLGHGWRDVADVLEEASTVEPVDPGQRRELEDLEASPWPEPVDDFGLEQADHALGEGVIQLSPTPPIEGSISASASRLV